MSREEHRKIIGGLISTYIDSQRQIGLGVADIGIKEKSETRKKSQRNAKTDGSLEEIKHLLRDEEKCIGAVVGDKQLEGNTERPRRRMRER